MMADYLEFSYDRYRELFPKIMLGETLIRSCPSKQCYCATNISLRQPISRLSKPFVCHMLSFNLFKWFLGGPISEVHDRIGRFCIYAYAEIECPVEIDTVRDFR